MKKTSLYEYFKNGRILIVDDMTNMRRSIKNFLRHIGVKEKNILEASDGNNALKIIKNDPQKILFVLLDWNMPHLTGIQTLKIMKEDKKLKNIPVLMITAENDQSQLAEAIEYKANGYVIKPFLLKTLEEKILNIINPPEYLKLLNEGEYLLNRGECDKALAIFQGVLKTKPESASIRILMGKAYEELKNYEKAHQLYKEAIDKNPHYLRAHINLAEFHIKVGDKKEGLKSLENAAMLNPNNANRQLTIGKLVLEEDSDPEKAGRAFKAAMKQSPQLAQEVAEIYLKNDMAEEAEMFFRSSLAKEKNIRVYNRLGIALRRQRKWKKAIEEYKKALQVEPANETIFFNMGMACLEGDKMGGHKKQDAVECFKKALKIDPNFKEAKEALKNIQT